MIRPTKVSIEYFLLVEDNSIKEPFVLIPASVAWQSKYSKRLRIVLLCVAGNCTYNVHGAMDAAVSDITSNLLLHEFLT